MNIYSRQFAAVVICVTGLSSAVLGAELQEADMHAHHHMMMQAMSQTKSSFVEYKVPRIELVRADGKHVFLDEELNDGRPVVMNFIYTTCTSVCPLTSRTFEELQDKLGTGVDRVHMMSVSIDPEQDTPEVLTQYARKYGAKPQWQFYTGTVEASIAAQHAFDVYRGSKMNHSPVTLIRTAPGNRWLRIEGFAKPDELLHDLGDIAASAEAPLPAVAGNEGR